VEINHTLRQSHVLLALAPRTCSFSSICFDHYEAHLLTWEGLLRSLTNVFSTKYMSRGVQMYGIKTSHSVFYRSKKKKQVKFSLAIQVKLKPVTACSFIWRDKKWYYFEATLNEIQFFCFSGTSSSTLLSWSHSLRRRWLRHWRVWLDILEPASSQPQQPQSSTSSQQFSLLSTSRFPYLVVLVLLCFASSAGQNSFILRLVHKWRHACTDVFLPFTLLRT